MTSQVDTYQVAGDDRFSDIHRNQAARPAGVSPHARMLIRRTISFEYELTADHYTDYTNAQAAEEERKMSIGSWFRQTDFDSADEIAFEIIWEDDDFSSVPGLAEHTAAAQEKIIEASAVPFADHDHGGPGGCPVCVGQITSIAAACDTITKAAQ